MTNQQPTETTSQSGASVGRGVLAQTGSPGGDPVDTSATARVADPLAFHHPGLVGRNREVGQTNRLTQDHRLVTITGPLGIGKTRLALEAAATQSVDLEVWVAELAAVDEDDLVPVVINAALGLEPEPGRSPADLAAVHLGANRALVVLDNCEHVRAGAARWAEHVLGRCAEVHLLATSQQALGLDTETIFRLGALRVPDDDAEPSTVTEALGFSAVELFCMRAASAASRFALTDETVPAVVDICRRLDGIPLAVEMAACRVASLGPADIADRLNQRFRLLTRGRPGADDRHQTLQAAVDWSYELLDEEEAMLLRRLSVFAGQATIDAVEAVCGGKGVPRDDVVDLLDQLVGKSLVEADTTRPRARYRLLETVQAYGRQRLEESGEALSLRTRHARWCVTIAERAWNAPAPRALEAAHDNLRAALAWTVAERPDLALRLTSALTPFWKSRGYFGEGARWLRAAIGATPPETARPLRARAWWGLGLLSILQGHVEEARSAGESSLATAREAGFRRAESGALNLLGLVHLFTQDGRAARPFLEASVSMARADADGHALEAALAMLGRTHLFVGDLASARDVFEECHRLAHSEDLDPSGAFIGLGWTALAEGEVRRAQAYLEPALEILEAAGERFEVALVLSFLGEAAWSQADPATGAAHVARGRELAEAMGAPFPHSRCLGLAARGALAAGERGEAEDLAHQSVRVATQAGMGYALARSLLLQGDVRRAVGLGAEAADAYEAARALAAGRDDRTGVADASYRLGRLARAQGTRAEASLLLQEALEIQDAVGDGGILATLEALAGLWVEQGRAAPAAVLLGAAEALRESCGLARPPEEAAEHEADLARLHEALDHDEIEAQWSKGSALSRSEAAELAMRGRGPRGRPMVGWGSLTDAETRIVDLVAEGLTNPEIAERLFISPRTVQGHMSRIFRKLGLESRREVRDARRRM